MDRYSWYQQTCRQRWK